VELNRQKQMAETQKKQRLEMAIRNIPDIKEATIDVKLIHYIPPVQPTNPHTLKIAIIGAPNAGKSTLINRFVGTKISAVSQKSHTTRSSILGIVTTGETQLSFVDTPGIINNVAGTKATRGLSLEAWSALTDVDLVILIVDCVKTISGDIDLKYIIKNIEDFQKKHQNSPNAILVLNKVDLADKIPEKDRKPIVGRFEKHFSNLRDVFSEIFTISALNGYKVLELQNWLIGQAKPKEWEYHEIMKTTQSELALCEEIIREKIFKRINKEVPYMVTLQNVGWTNLPNGTLRIDENILVKKLGHKRMVLGKSGRGIYGIIETASQDLQAILHRNVALHLNVKIDKSQEDADLL